MVSPNLPNTFSAVRRSLLFPDRPTYTYEKLCRTHVVFVWSWSRYHRSTPTALHCNATSHCIAFAVTYLISSGLIQRMFDHKFIWSDHWLINVLDCQARRRVFKFPLGIIWFESSAPPARPLPTHRMSTLAVSCQYEDETAMERIGYPPAYAENKKKKSLTCT